MTEEQNNTMPETIPYVVHESEVARLERTIKRLFIICVLLIIVAVGTNAYWIWYEAQFEDIVTTVTQDLDSGDGGTAIINDGVHVNGEDQTVGNDKTEKT
jgi:hypothetical protein